MRIKTRISVIILLFATLSIAGAYLSTRFQRANAEQPGLWISIDARELQMVLDRAKLDGTDLPTDVVAYEEGIAVLQANDWQMQQISSYMHELRNKCSGFVAHQSKEEALQSIGQLFSVNPLESFVTYTIDNQANVNQLLPMVQEPATRQTIIDLSAFPNRRYNQPSGLTSAQFIKDSWTALAQNRPDITVEFFNHPAATSPQPSVIMTIPGTTIPGEEVVLGAHQDSINSSGPTAAAPGADDDASGVASLTEAIRVLITKNFRPQRTVKFMAYAAEEAGLRGSNAISTDYRNRNVNVIGVLQLDMTNYKGSTGFDISLITDFTNAAQNTFVTNLITAYLPALTVSTSVCGYACSDHASWTSKNYPSSFPFEATFGQHNNALHTTNDTIARSSNNANHAVKFTKVALAFVGELAKGSVVQVPTSRARADFDGDGKTDISVFRPASGLWYLNRSTSGLMVINWGISTDKPVPADYDGDGKTDVAVFRANNDSNLPDFYVLRTGDFTFSGASWGLVGDIPTVADYDGDGKADISIFRPSTNTWYNLNSADGSVLSRSFGINGDRPVVGNFDGDGKADLNVIRNQNEWFTVKSSTGYSTVQQTVFGLSGDIPVPADFDGDGTDNIAVFRPANGTWYYLRTDSNISFAPFGSNGDVPATGDFDGDGKSDYAVFRPATGVWYVLRSSNGSLQIENFGLGTDIPVPFAYQPGG